MAERIEFVGNPLPTGLPGFGGGTVSVLILPGFNTVVAVQQFGPVVDAQVTPPDPDAPPGSNPENPTNEVVDPGPAPYPPNQTRPNFCKECVDQNDVGQSPLMYGIRYEDSCVGCDGRRKTVTRYFSELTASSEQAGVFYSDTASITGKLGDKEWTISPTELILDQAKASLTSSQLALDVNGALETYYQAGPTIQGPDGKEYSPQDLEVCNGTNTETWKVLAWKP
jgi:hypothetical protein